MFFFKEFYHAMNNTNLVAKTTSCLTDMREHIGEWLAYQLLPPFLNIRRLGQTNSFQNI
jgi:hypothetical protein